MQNDEEPTSAAIRDASNAPKKIKSVVPFNVSNGLGLLEKREINHAPIIASNVLPVAVINERISIEWKGNSETIKP